MSKTVLTRRFFMKTCLGVASWTVSRNLACGPSTGRKDKPNIVIIFCDDLGYGDLGVFGHPTIRTPNLDRMAREGQKWTNFYAAASVCTPSRAGLITGRLPVRSGMCSDRRRVLFPDSSSGLPEGEVTIAEALKARDYVTACVGKWHLGHLPRHLPTNNGFDSYFGIPYSNDMDKAAGPGVDVFKDSRIEYFNVPLMRDEEIVERPADQTTITKRYTEEAVKIIRQNKDNPFFLYLAHNLPHVPLFRSQEFVDKSRRGIYGDVVEEIDSGVGLILNTLRELRLDKNTLVVFTSDNGPWLSFKEQGGSAGLLNGGKGMTWDGGMREPTIFWWPGKIHPGVVADMGSTLDLFATACVLAGAKVPDDRIMDSLDLGPALFGTGKSPREVMFFYRGTRIYAVRKGPFKAHFYTEWEYTKNNDFREHDPPLLFHLEHDPSEKHNVADKYPDVIEDIRREVDRHNKELVKGEDQLVKRIAEL